jgi:hypothetical protein
VLFLNEDTEITNFGEHLLRRACDEVFSELRVAPRLLAGAHVPGVGLAETLENASVPMLDSTLDAMRGLARAPEVGRSQKSIPVVARRRVFDFMLDPRELERVATREVLGRSARYR